MFDEGNWLVAEPFGHNDFDAFSVIDKEFLKAFLQTLRLARERHRDHIAIHMDRLDPSNLKQRTGHEVSRPIGQDIVSRAVDLVSHAGKRTIGLESDHAGD